MKILKIFYFSSKNGIEPFHLENYECLDVKMYIYAQLEV